MFVVKGSTAKDAITQKNPLEKPSAFAILQQHRLIGGGSDRLYLQFLISEQLDGIRPSLPTIEIASPSGMTNSSNSSQTMEEKVLQITGAAIFNDKLEMQGSINNLDNKNLLWIMGLLTKNTIISEHEKGNASAQLYKISSKVTPVISEDNRVKFNVLLKGEGFLQENNSGLDVRIPKSLKKIETEFLKTVKKQAEKTIKKLQTEYEMDIFGFGEAIHYKHPTKWNSLKDNWDEHFSQADMDVQVIINIREIGLDGPSILIRRSGKKQ